MCSCYGNSCPWKKFIYVHLFSGNLGTDKPLFKITISSYHGNKKIPQDTISHSLKWGPWFWCEDLFTLEVFTVRILIQTQSPPPWQARCTSATMCDGGHTHFGPRTLHWDKSAVHAYVHAYTAVMWTTQGELQSCNNFYSGAASFHVSWQLCESVQLRAGGHEWISSWCEIHKLWLGAHKDNLVLSNSQRRNEGGDGLSPYVAGSAGKMTTGEAAFVVPSTSALFHSRLLSTILVRDTSMYT